MSTVETPSVVIHSTPPKKRRHRFKAGTVALRDIRRYQKTSNLLLKRGPMDRVIRQIAVDAKSDVRWTGAAIDAIHTAAEEYLLDAFKAAMKITAKSKRQTMMLEDYKLGTSFITRDPID